jgi:hypothetical protein
MDTVKIKNLDRGTIVAQTAKVAETSTTRRRGLLGRDALPTGEGLWIVPCESVHTAGMRFPIDVLFLSRDRRILKIRRNMKPWSISGCLRAHSVLELPAGAALATGAQTGDQLQICDSNTDC